MVVVATRIGTVLDNGAYIQLQQADLAMPDQIPFLALGIGICAMFEQYSMRATLHTVVSW